ncbi:magnesium transporter [Flavicella sp.]|uniref:magnesium transporter n=1 Tax=Flavicella sp. TaxID=2957742 RepID=UPI0026378AD5|nr:magnesium transporter [Flavicella sp.]MDG1805762.1 magnesium transporter [Flavicella sp.]MDG2280522.1 magnesium transporter [Flavicella sp.]
MTHIEITPDFLSDVKELIAKGDNRALSLLFEEMHHADLAEVLDDLNFDDAVFIIRLLDTEKTADILTELDEDTREKILQELSSKEIAKEIGELDSDDAADIIGELPEEQKNEVISQIEDVEHAKDIVDLLRYDEDTAGGLMGKELIKVNENWANLRCVKEMRKQAEDYDKVHTIYVVDDNDVLKGRLSLKSLLTTSTKTPVKDVYNPKITFVRADENDEDVAKTMQKYDLFVVPVVDEMNRLIGQITLDDVVDVIRDEADKDYQMAAGITDDVEADDSILQLTKARLPWLVLGLLGGLGAGSIMGGFEEALKNYPNLFFFTPLIAAMAGNVGVQSSAIMVQGLANNNIKGSVVSRLLKEVGLTLLNGLALALLVTIYGFFQIENSTITFVIALALMIVITIAAVIGTFIPILLDRNGIDPALATGPFITTSNDIFGILIYFMIAKFMLGF